jgi:hypothetical protein
MRNLYGVKRLVSPLLAAVLLAGCGASVSNPTSSSSTASTGAATVQHLTVSGTVCVPSGIGVPVSHPQQRGPYPNRLAEARVEVLVASSSGYAVSACAPVVTTDVNGQYTLQVDATQLPTDGRLTMVAATDATHSFTLVTLFTAGQQALVAPTEPSSHDSSLQNVARHSFVVAAPELITSAAASDLHLIGGQIDPSTTVLGVDVAAGFSPPTSSSLNEFDGLIDNGTSQLDAGFSSAPPDLQQLEHLPELISDTNHDAPYMTALDNVYEFEGETPPTPDVLVQDAEEKPLPLVQ